MSSWGHKHAKPYFPSLVPRAHPCMQHAFILENAIESLTTSKYLTACPIPFVKAFQGLSSTELWTRSKSQPDAPTEWFPTQAPAS